MQHPLQKMLFPIVYGYNFTCLLQPPEIHVARNMSKPTILANTIVTCSLTKDLLEIKSLPDISICINQTVCI